MSESLDLAARLMRERIRARLVGARSQPLRIGRFELKRACGQGGQGSVYEAWDTLAEARVALKYLHSVHAERQDALQREFRALRHILHPNLVAMHELFCVDGTWFFTMEHIAGVSIARHVAEQAARAERTRSTVAQLLRGLMAVHVAGLVHRDVKPANVLVEPCGRVVLVDFGLALVQADLVGTFHRSGTPAYMAPELVAGSGTPSPAADLYGVGAVTFELLTGINLPDARPSQGAARGTQRLRALLAASDAPPDLAELCCELLASDPGARPSAHESLARLCRGPVMFAAVEPLARDPSLELIGRDAELERLHAAAESCSRADPRASTRADEQGPRIVLVHGESGIGKSALLSCFAEELRARGPTLVLEGRCYERESTPYKVFEEVVSALVQHLAALPGDAGQALVADLSAALRQPFPAFGALFQRGSEGALQAGELACAEQARARAFAALRELLARVARTTPIVLVVDDLQWGDLDSLRLLEALFAPKPPLPMLLVGSYRTGEVATCPFLRELLRSRTLGPPLAEIEQIPLLALSPQQARQLVAQVAPGGAGAARLDSARGVPFLLLETALAALDGVPDGSAETDVDALLARRVGSASPAAQALLSVLSVAGRPLSIAIATRAAPHPRCNFECALELAARRLVRFRDVDGTRCLEPYHDRVRAHVLLGLAAPRVAELHLAIDAAMERLGVDDAPRRVEHLLAGGERARAAELALCAAQQACAQLAWIRAPELLSAALGVDARGQNLDQRGGLPRAARDPHALRRQHAEVLAFAGMHAEAGPAYQLAARSAGTDGERAVLERLAARQYLRAGFTHTGMSLFRAAFARVGLGCRAASGVRRSPCCGAARRCRRSEVWRACPGVARSDRPRSVASGSTRWRPSRARRGSRIRPTARWRMSGIASRRVAAASGSGCRRWPPRSS
jgi:tRNA A-37 threonylcarbamoyl transferase component Bud32